MAFFKFRKSTHDLPQSPLPCESVDVVRKRARHRLMGAAVLVLGGVLGFPLIFDNQPRPISVDTQIEIPDKNRVKPLMIPGQTASDFVASGVPSVSTPPSRVSAPVPLSEPATAMPTPAASVAVVAALTIEPQGATPAERPAEPAVRTAKQNDATATLIKPPTPTSTPTPTAAIAPAKSIKSDSEAVRAQALLDGKTAAPSTLPTGGTSSADANTAVGERFIVQVGAYADEAKAREARAKLERAGLKTYTHVVETKDGKRIRVRVGPYATRALADAAADQVKRLELPAVVLTL